MNFCSECGATVTLRVPQGDCLPRFVCGHCETIHYINPKLVVGAIAQWEDQVLLCRRAIEPRHGKWTLPAGFMEMAETTAEGAARETLEEACARIEVGPLYALINVAHISQVHLFYRARLLDLDFAPGTESLEVRLFREDEIPWDELAFRSVSMSLRLYFEDRRHNEFPLRTADITRPAPEHA